MPYESLVDQRIFKPLDMNTASIGYQAFVENPNHAKPHSRRKGQWKTVPVQPNYYRAAPAAGVNASILDMGKWLQAQLGSQPEAFLGGKRPRRRVRTDRQLVRQPERAQLPVVSHPR